MTVASHVRLDTHLVRAGIARSRGHAASLVAAGRVLVDGVPAVRPAAAVRDPAAVAVLGDPAADFASRAGDKLDAALEAFGPGGPRIDEADCLDVGASTGGFTDVLLRRGARSVLAVDVGHDQLRDHLRADPRVTARDGLDVRDLAERLRAARAAAPGPAATGPTTRAVSTDPGSAATTATTGPVSRAVEPGRDETLARLPAAVVVADLSFIPLRAVFPALDALTAADGDLLTLVKPQFEVGRERLPHTGVVRDPADRAAALTAVAAAAAALGWGTAAARPSSRAGRTGNVEFVVWWRRDAAPADPDTWTALAMTDAGDAPGVGQDDRPDPHDPQDQHDPRTDAGAPGAGRGGDR